MVRKGASERPITAISSWPIVGTDVPIVCEFRTSFSRYDLLPASPESSRSALDVAAQPATTASATERSVVRPQVNLRLLAESGRRRTEAVRDYLATQGRMGISEGVAPATERDGLALHMDAQIEPIARKALERSL